MPDLTGFLGTVGSLSNLALPWYQERNAQEIREKSLRADETVRLASMGFTTGRAGIAAVPRQNVGINLGSSSLGGGSSLMRYAPVALLAVLALTLVRR